MSINGFYLGQQSHLGVDTKYIQMINEEHCSFWKKSKIAALGTTRIFTGRLEMGPVSQGV